MISKARLTLTLTAEPLQRQSQVVCETYDFEGETYFQRTKLPPQKPLPAKSPYLGQQSSQTAVSRSESLSVRNWKHWALRPRKPLRLTRDGEDGG